MIIDFFKTDMQEQYPKYYRSNTGEEQIKIFSPIEQAYVRAIKLRNGFDYCAYRNRLEDGEEQKIKDSYIPSSEVEYLCTIEKVISFFKSLSQLKGSPEQKSS